MISNTSISRATMLTFGILMAVLILNEGTAQGQSPMGIESFNDTYHVWNENDDYYIDAVSGIQLTNHYDEYWSHNEWCTYLKLGQWIKACSDDFTWTWETSTDDQTYSNLTGYASNSYAGGYKIDVILEYYLEENDTSVRITPYVKNDGKTFTGYIIWRIEDIRVGMTEDFDVLILNGDKYELDDELDISEDNLSRLKLRVVDMQTTTFLDFSWNNSIWINGIAESINYTLKVKSETNQFNAPTELWIFIEDFRKGDVFHTSFRWIDAFTSSETLYVDSHSGDRTEWDANSGDLPYIDDSVSYIHEISSGGKEEGDFGFANCSVCVGAITSVVLYFECQAEDAPDEGWDVHLDNGTGFANTGNFLPSTKGSYVWDTWDVSGYVTSWLAVDNLMMYLDTINDGGGDDRYLMRAYLNVTYTISEPDFSNPEINETGDIFIGMMVNHTMTISDNPTQYLFSWNATGVNCDTWVNSSWIDVSGASVTGWNASVIPSACQGKQIGWRFYGNNSGGINVSDVETYDVYGYGTLDVEWTTGSVLNDTDCSSGSPCTKIQNALLTANATVTCSGGIGAKCGTVSVGMRNNDSATLVLMNVTEGAVPFYVTGGIVSDVYENQTDGFSIAFIGGYAAFGIVFDSTDDSFWICEGGSQDFVYHVSHTGENQTDGFSVGAVASDVIGLAYNSSDDSFWLGDYVEDEVYHVNNVGDDLGDGFDPKTAGLTNLQGMASNGSDFWLVDDGNDFVYHFNSTGDNQTDGFDVGTGSWDGIAFDLTDDSFWIAESDTDFVYHFNSTGDNQTDGFSIPFDDYGTIYGIAFDSTDDSLWLISADTYVYHFSKGAVTENPIDLGALNNGESAQANFTMNFTGSGLNILDMNFSSSYADVNDNSTADAYITTAVVDNPPTVTLKSPDDDGTVSSTTVNYACYVSDGNAVVNVSFYHNYTIWHRNSTNTSALNNVNYTFTATIPDGNSSLWNCYACDDIGQCAWAAANRTVTVSLGDTCDTCAWDCSEYCTVGTNQVCTALTISNEGIIWVLADVKKTSITFYNTNQNCTIILGAGNRFY